MNASTFARGSMLQLLKSALQMVRVAAALCPKRLWRTRYGIGSVGDKVQGACAAISVAIDAIERSL